MTLHKPLAAAVPSPNAFDAVSARTLTEGSDTRPEKETPPQGRRRAGDAISGGVYVDNYARSVLLQDKYFL